jgi:DNA-directed RNA polymerase subunit A"
MSSSITDEQIEELIGHIPKDKVETRMALIKQLKSVPIDDFGEKEFLELKDTLREQYSQAIIAPGEPVGIKSVDYNESIIIKEGDDIKVVKIGEFIDKEMEGISGDSSETYYIEYEDKNFHVPSVDMEGNISWKKIIALTKHLPINKDGTSTLVKVTTRTGRIVIATKGESFLTRKENLIVPTRGDELKVGEYLPMMIKLPECEHNYLLDITQWYPKDEYIYGTEIYKAKKFRDERRREGNPTWFFANGEIFTVPHRHACSLSHAIDGNKYEIGCIYPKISGSVRTEFPEKLELDSVTGFFFGACLAEGSTRENSVLVTNNDEMYREKIKNFAEKLNINFSLNEHHDEERGWSSVDVILYSIMLTKFLLETMGKYSHNKCIPNFVYNSSDEFLSSFLDGYFSGDGCIDTSKNEIKAVTTSEKLVDGIMLLLTRFGIFSKKSKPTKHTSNNLGTTAENIHQQWYITISGGDNIRKFAENVKLSIKTKQEKMEVISRHKYAFENGMYDKIPGNKLDCLKLVVTKKTRKNLEKGIVHREKLRELYEREDVSENEKLIIENVLNSNIYYDEIISIEEVEPSHRFTYDLTVEETKTFCLESGILMYDTSSAIAAPTKFRSESR